MPIVTQNYRYSVADEFVKSFAEDWISYYLFIGKILPWANEASPDTGNTSLIAQKDAWDCMISAKLIRGDSIRLVLPNNQWVSNTIYTPYDDADPNYYANTSALRYVLTANLEVYMCIDNSGNSNSSVEPFGTNNNNGFIKTPDGYLWKYMFPVDNLSADNLFLTPDYIPVPRTSVPTTSIVPGTLDRILLTAPGFGYNSANAGVNLAIVNITGDGVGATAVANVGPTGNLVSVTVISQGIGYSYANIQFSGGSGGTARAVLSPVNGHASAPAEELNAKTALMAMRIGKNDATEGGTFTIQNDFRQFGILKNPYKYGTTDISSSNSLSQTVAITIVADANPNFSIDDFVFQIDPSGNTVFSGYVVDIGTVSNTSVIQVTQTRGAVQTGNLIFNTNAATSKRVQSFANPPLQKYTGEILYFENIVKTQRNNNQAETFKILFAF
jgi:hypothetical protein